MNDWSIVFSEADLKRSNRLIKINREIVRVCFLRIEKCEKISLFTQLCVPAKIYLMVLEAIIR